MKRIPKKGERFRVIEHPSNDGIIPIGSTGIVLETDHNPWVKMDDDSLNMEHVTEYGNCAILSKEEMEVIK